MACDAASTFWVRMSIYPRAALATNFSSEALATVRHNLLVDPDPSLELGLVYNDFPSALSGFQSIGSTSFFDTIQADILKTLENVRLIHSKNATFHSHPMRDLCFEVPEKGLSYRIRIIVVKPRMY